MLPSHRSQHAATGNIPVPSLLGSARQRIDTLMEKSTQALQMAWQLSGGQHKEDHHTGGKMVAAVLHDASQEAEPFFQQARASV